MNISSIRKCQVYREAWLSLAYAPLAQLVEQLTLNQWVRGSSPRRCTRSGNRVPKSVFLSQRVHPFPFRTRKLSSAEPKILAWRRAGTIGHCRHLARATVLAAKGNMGMHSDTPLVSLYFYSSLAQSVERVTVNHDVAGSSPAGGATKKPPKRVAFCVALS